MHLHELQIGQQITRFESIVLGDPRRAAVLGRRHQARTHRQSLQGIPPPDRATAFLPTGDRAFDRCAGAPASPTLPAVETVIGNEHERHLGKDELSVAGDLASGGLELSVAVGTGNTSTPALEAGTEQGPRSSEPVSIEPGEVRRLPVLEEVLEITKQEVDRGGYRITKRVETRDEVVDELLRSDNVQIERRAVNVAIPDGAIPGIRQEGDTLIVPVIEEVVITVKRLVLVEEVRITRTQSTERKPQTYTLRREHIEVERLAAEQPTSVKVS